MRIEQLKNKEEKTNLINEILEEEEKLFKRLNIYLKKIITN